MRTLDQCSARVVVRCVESPPGRKFDGWQIVCVQASNGSPGYDSAWDLVSIGRPGVMAAASYNAIHFDAFGFVHDIPLRDLTPVDTATMGRRLAPAGRDTHGLW